jgi:Pectate lyase superfamily protein
MMKRTKAIWLMAFAAIAISAVSTCARPPESTGIVSVKQFGARGDGRHDDQPAIQSAIDSLASQAQPTGWPHVGGVVTFPRGQYVVKKPIKITVPNITLQGCGMPSSKRTCALVSGVGGPVLLFPEAGRNPRPFAMRHLSIVGNKIEGGQYVIVPGSRGIEIHSDAPGGFRRRIILENVGIFGMDIGLLVTRDKGLAQIGELRIRDCTISRNRIGIQFANATSCNLLSITDSSITQNVERGGRIRAYGGVITGNSVEGQPEGLIVTGRGLLIAGNHSEVNSGVSITAEGHDILMQANYYYYPPDFVGKRDKFKVTSKR